MGAIVWARAAGYAVGVTIVAVVGGGFGGVGAVVMLRRAGYDDVTVFERGERIGGVWHHNTYPGRRLRRALAPVRVLVRPQPALVAALRAAGRDPGLPRGRRARARRARPDPDRRRGAAARLGRRARPVGAADERRRARGRRAAHRLRAAVGAAACRRSRGSTASPARPSTPRAGATTSTLDGQARGGGRHRLQRDPGRARRSSRSSASSTSTSARRAGRSRKMDFAYSERTKRLFERFPALQRLDRAAIFAFHELGAAAMTQPAAGCWRRSARSAAVRSTRRSRTPSCAARSRRATRSAASG